VPGDRSALQAAALLPEVEREQVERGELEVKAFVEATLISGPACV